MTIAFTVCSNNYLAQAKTFIDSLVKFNPETKTYIFLVDKKSPDIDYKFFSPAEIIEVDDSIVGKYSVLVERYDIVELNTCVKPFLFQYLFNKNEGAKSLYYFDPDICIYNSLSILDKLLLEHDIVLTPHFCTPLPLDGLEPFENLSLNYGTYNLGFLAVNPSSQNVGNFLKWWGERTFHYGYSKVDQGFFVDQLWFNLVPIFFDKVYTLKDYGYNMAPWNIHEREILDYKETGEVLLNSGQLLVFFHFSSFRFSTPDLISTKYNRYNFEKRPSLIKLYKDYHAVVMQNRQAYFEKFKCSLPIKEIKLSPLKKVLYPAILFLRKLWRKV